MTVRLPRRLVVFDVDGASTAVMDGTPAAAVVDPARPGFSATRYWITDTAPATLARPVGDPALPDRLEPPPNGSVCRVLVIPPDQSWMGSVTADDVRAYFESVGAPHASLYSPDAPHPYMQRTRTLDFCLIVSGEVTLVLDTEEVHLRAGDTVVQRATSHAWSNRTGEPCVIAVSSHDARRPD